MTINPEDRAHFENAVVLLMLTKINNKDNKRTKDSSDKETENYKNELFRNCKNNKRFLELFPDLPEYLEQKEISDEEITTQIADYVKNLESENLEEDVVDIIYQASVAKILQKIPDNNFVELDEKEKFVKEYAKGFLHQDTYFYDKESPSSNLGKTTEAPHNLKRHLLSTIESFKASESIYKSEYILLVTPLLLEYDPENSSLFDVINKINILFINAEYDKCIKIIRNVIETGNMPHESVSLLLNYSTKLKDDNYQIPESSDARRAFETSLANKHFEDLSKNPKTQDNLRIMLKELYPGCKFTSLEEIEFAVNNAFSVIEYKPWENPPLEGKKFYEDNLKSFAKSKRFRESAGITLRGKVEFIKTLSTRYQERTRVQRPIKDQGFASNLGIFRPLQRIPNNLLSRFGSTGRPTTRFIPNPNKPYNLDYNRKSPYVSSVSGHTIENVMVFEYFAKNYKGKNPQVSDKELENIANDFFAFAATLYVKNGYHSYPEILPVLEDEVVKKQLGKINVNPIQSISNDAFHSSSKDVGEYVRANMIKRKVAEELPIFARKITDNEQKTKFGIEGAVR